MLKVDAVMKSQSEHTIAAPSLLIARKTTQNLALQMAPCTESGGKMAKLRGCAGARSFGLLVFSLLAAVFCFCGCATVQYRVLQPQGVAQIITDQPVQVSYAPLVYHFVRQQNRLSMQINNPTDETIVLVGERSSVVDPAGETRPLRGRLINPRSFVQMLLPPQTISIPYTDYWGWGWGWGPYWGPSWGPWGPYNGWWGPPPVSFYTVRTVFDWNWKTGPVRLHLTYDRKGTVFEHDFEIVREVK